MFDWRTLPRPIIALSPMADMTDSAFCRIARRFGAQVVFREMVSSEALARGNGRTLAMAGFSADERPIVQQLFGADPKAISAGVRRVDEAWDPDAFDINMGCPVYKLTCNFNGAALMRDPDAAEAVIRAARSATAKPVSVKCRLGWSDPGEILKFIGVIETAGADLVTIHGRTKAQGYSGRADWEMIGRAKRLANIPVLANGDIDSGAAAKEALRASGCDGVMVGRGALGNPWVFREIAAALSGGTAAPPTLEERLAVVREHAALHALAHPGEAPLVTFRKHLICYFKGMPGARGLREQLTRVSTADDLEAILERIGKAAS